MGTEDLKKIKQDRTHTRRESLKKKFKKSILIVTEGEQTEVNYFKAFPVQSIRVEVKGTGKNTATLLEEAISLWENLKNSGEIYEKIFVVMDKDDFPLKNYNSTFVDASHWEKKLNKTKSLLQNGPFSVTIIYSNEAFELWYILHFNLLVSSTGRDDLIVKLKKQLSNTYKKNATNMYDLLLEHQNTAIRNAKKTRENSLNDPTVNPTTNVDILVQELNQHR